MASDRGNLSRKMAAIVHADVAGSTALVQLDETLAHERINQAFSRFSQSIENYGGTVHEIRGDALVAEFPRASDAVCAALAFQERHHQVLAELKDAIVPRVRIGVSLGEAIFADGQVTGAGVVLAQRVEQLAEPGGMCITGAIHEAIPQHMPLLQVSLGEQEVKGFEEAIRVYRVALKPGELIPPPEKAQKPRATNTLGISAAVAAIVLVIAGGAVFRFQPWAPEEEPASVERMAFPLPDKPSIAVLPFVNMSDDAEQEYFVDGMTEDLITDLSNLSGLFVIARNSVFTYKGKPVKVKQVAEELGVRYVLEGSVRRASDQIRINAQLIDATSGGHVWAKRYDGSIQDVFALQDQVSAQIVSALAMNLTTQESARIEHVQTDVTQAYDLFLRGMQHYMKATPDHYAEALKFFHKALELDPEFSHAHAALASVYFNSFRQQFFIELGLEAFEAWNKAEEHLQQAMNVPTSLAFQVASGLSLTGRNHEEAIEYAENATALEPNDANAHATLAFALIMAAHPEQALASVNLARRLDPHNEYYYRFLQGLSEFGQENYPEAMTSFEQALELNPELWLSGDGYWCAPSPIGPLIAVYYYLGKQEALDKLLREIESFCPVKTTMLGWPFKETQDHDRLSNGLQGAGIPTMQALMYSDPG